MLESRPSMQESRTAVVVIPAHNEAAVISQVLAQVPAQVEGLTVIPVVIDDGSTDATLQVARHKGVFVVHHLTNLGVGAATITGLRAAQSFNPEIVITMDADGQHDPADIQSLVRPLLNDSADVVIGSRTISPAGMPHSRLAANLLLNVITYVLYGSTVSDSQSGFKAFSRRALQVLELDSSGYEICSEIVGEIYRKKLRCVSVPIRPVYTRYSRRKGQHFLNGVNLVIDLVLRVVRRV